MPLSPDAKKIADAVRRANDGLGHYVRRTPLVLSPHYSELFGHTVYLKLENRQRTGSFKFRGAMNRLLDLTPEERKKGCVTASSGNHGAAIAAALTALNIRGVIYVPESVSTAKLGKIERLGGQVRKFGTDGLDTEIEARRVASDAGMTYVSPYNDPAVIAGQGSIADELLTQLPHFDRILVAVGGGGLISGVASRLKCTLPELHVIGCQPSASAVMARSCRVGRIIEEVSSQTLSDGTAGGVEKDAVTLPLCQELVDEFCLVDETEIATAMAEYQRVHKQKIEGAAALGIAALRQINSRCDERTVLIICGGNVSDAVFAGACDVAAAEQSSRS